MHYSKSNAFRGFLNFFRLESEQQDQRYIGFPLVAQMKKYTNKQDGEPYRKVL